MHISRHFVFGEEDEQYAPVIAERRLYLAVFMSALVDLLGSDRYNRREARKWFNGDCETLISYKEIKEMFRFKPSRLKRLKYYIENCDELAGKRMFRVRVRTHAKSYVKRA